MLIMIRLFPIISFLIFLTNIEANIDLATDAACSSPDSNLALTVKTAAKAAKEITDSVPGGCSSLKPMTVQEKLNPLGAHLIQHYYKSKLDTFPVFNLNTAKDIPVLLNRISENHTVGLTVVTRGRHRTPIVFKNGKAIILESLGTETSKVGKGAVAMLAIAIEASEKKYQIFTVQKNRQVDALSCGIDANQVLKQAFRNSDDLFSQFDNKDKETKTFEFAQADLIDPDPRTDSFYQRELPVQVIQSSASPSYIAKYTQSMSAICKLPEKHSAVSYNSAIYKETLLEYANRHSITTAFPKMSGGVKEAKVISVDLGNKSEEIRLNKMQMTQMNSSIASKRKKLALVTVAMLHNLSCDQISDIIYESSGLKFLMGNRPLSEVLKHPSGGALIKKFLDEQKTVDRDQNNDVADLNQVSLRDIQSTFSTSRD